jgi:hypothetical protein
MGPMPDLHLRHTHLLITQTLLTLYELDLTPNESNAGTIHAEGKAGTREDKSVDFKVNFERVPIVAWLPAGWKDHFSGIASGKIHWTGKNPKLESASRQGSLRIKAGRVDGLPFLKKLTSLTRNEALEHLDLTIARSKSYGIIRKSKSKTLRSKTRENYGSKVQSRLSKTR